MSLGSLVREMKVLAGLAALAVCTGCAAETSSSSSEEGAIATTTEAITNGADDDKDMAVVSLLIGGKIFCSGVLISANVVATAGHCVNPTPPEQVYFGSDPGVKKSGTLIAVADSKVHPEFDPDTLENDIALIGLASNAKVTPLPIFTGDFDASYVGKAIRLVGFGAPAIAADSDLRKRSGNTTIQSYGDDDFRFHPGPSQTCNGDSGGAAFTTIDGREVVIGIASSGDQNCVTYGRDMRIDRYEPFIKSYTKAYSAGAGALTGPQTSAGCAMAPRSPGRGSSSAALLLAAGCAAIMIRARRARRAAASTR